MTLVNIFRINLRLSFFLILDILQMLYQFFLILIFIFTPWFSLKYVGFLYYYTRVQYGFGQKNKFGY